MTSRQLDVLFVTPDSAASAYQGLSTTYSAVEPPTWSLLLAQSCRSKGFGVAILDCLAERLSDIEAIRRIDDANPRLVCFVLYGQNPNSGTTSMIGAIRMGAALKVAFPKYPICFVGSHVSALPKQVLTYPFVDIILLNEGVYALHDLLKSDLNQDLSQIRGIGFRREGVGILCPPQRVVPHERMDVDLPGYAWDLLPYTTRPLDLYRSHLWHADYNLDQRTPFAALYTSLGCRFRCDFCMINIVNRVDNGDGIVGSDSALMRFWSPKFILGEFEKLVHMGVETIRICDEMFMLDRRYFEPLLQGIVDRQWNIRSWSYARVDSVQPKFLSLFKRAGINWLGLGVEAANQMVRREVSKGSFKEVGIREIVRLVQDNGINVGANYIFGFPDDTFDTMQQTLSLALELNTEFANMYSCQALPGSPLYRFSTQNGWPLPSTLEAFAFLSYECEPMPTKYLTAAQVLKFRDEAWHTYFTHGPYLDLVQRKFGAAQRKTVEEMAKIRLKRKILGD